MNNAQSYDLLPILIKRLSNIINKTNCKIILSSDWRLKPDYKDELFLELKTKGNINMISDNIYIGDTPVINGGYIRALEIKQALKTIKKNEYSLYEIKAWCAVDDLYLIREMLGDYQYFMQGHFVKTDSKKGLSEENMNEIIHILNGNYLSLYH